MKNRRFGFMDPKIIMSVVVSLIILGVGAFAVFVVIDESDKTLDNILVTNTYTETFETDINATAPASDWYTYTGVDWAWANVTNLTGRGTSSNSFRINDTTGADKYSNFTFTTDDYEYFQMWFKWRNDTHNQTRLYIVDEDGFSTCMFDLGGHPAAGGTETVVFSNYTGRWESSNLTNNTWYRLRADFNWASNTVRGRLFDGADALLNDSGYVGMADSSLTSDNMKKLVFTGYTTNPAYIWFDDFTLYDSDIASRTDISGTADSVFNIIGIILIIGSILLIIGMASKYYD